MRLLQITSFSNRTDHSVADGGDGSAKRERSVIYDCLVINVKVTVVKMMSVVLSRITQQRLSNDDCRENKREDD